MKVALYTGNNGDTRALANRAKNLMELWPDAYVAAKIADLKGSDVVFNQMLDQIERVEAQRRFTGCGKQVCLFAANVAELGVMTVRQCLLWLEHVPVVVHSPFHLREVRDQLQVFSPAHRRKLEANLHYIPGGIHADFTAAGTNDRAQWVVPYNRFNQQQKQMALHAELTQKTMFLLRGEKVQTTYYLRNVEEELAGATTDLSLYNVQPCPPTRAEYIANAQKSGMFLSTSAYESFGMMYLELLLAGNVGVFLDRPWIRELLPDYQLVASKKDLPAMMAAVYRDYDKAQAYVRDHVAPHIRQNYTFTAFAEKLRALLETTAKGAA